MSVFLEAVLPTPSPARADLGTTAAVAAATFRWTTTNAVHTYITRAGGGGRTTRCCCAHAHAPVTSPGAFACSPIVSSAHRTRTCRNRSATATGSSTQTRKHPSDRLTIIVEVYIRGLRVSIATNEWTEHTVQHHRRYITPVRILQRTVWSGESFSSTCCFCGLILDFHGRVLPNSSTDTTGLPFLGRRWKTRVCRQTRDFVDERASGILY